jgi:hypothetical protein
MEKEMLRAEEKTSEPSELPVGITSFYEWADSFFKLYDLPTQDRDSIHMVLASEIINLKPGVTKVPKDHFYSILLSAAQKQIAGSVFQEIQQNKFAAEKQAKRDAEAAASAKVVANESVTV